jgi:hypothetical protein
LESVHIFEWRNSSGDGWFKNMPRERELNENSMDGGIIVEVFNCGKELIDKSATRLRKSEE